MTGRRTLSRAGGLPTRSRGFALLLVLWLAMLVTMLAGGLAFSTRSETAIGRSSVSRAEAEVLADAAVKRAVLGMSKRQSEPWVADGREYSWSYADAELTVSISPESGKVDLNRAPEAVLQSLFSSLSAKGIVERDAAQRMTDSLIDWRDSDEDRRALGAEDPAYAAAGLPYGAADRPLLAVAELGQISGFSGEAVGALHGLVTVHAASTRIDATTAPQEVLLALPGASSSDVDRFVQEREQLLKEWAAAEEGGSSSRGQRRQLPLQILGQAGKYLTASSRTRVYAVRVRGTSARGGLVARDAVVRVPGKKKAPYSVLAWVDPADAPVEEEEF